MGKIRRVPRCYHCGMVLQSTNPNEKGYVSPEVLNREVPVQIIYCDSCYNSMIEMNKIALSQNVDEQILKILDDAVATDALIVWVVDLFSFNGLLNTEIAKKIKNLNVCVIGTKYDLISRYTKKEILIDYLTTRFEKAGIKPCSIRLMSTKETVDGMELLKAVNEKRAGHDVYMIGNQLSGKTSIINKALKSYVNKTKREIKTEMYPGTEVKVFEVPITRSASFYELPGISQTTSVTSKVEKEILKIITPRREIKETAKVLSAGEALVIGSLAFFEIVKGKKATYRFYSNELVENKKVAAKNAQKTIIDNYQTKTIRPVSNSYSTFRDYDFLEISMENDGKLHDLNIEGLGWLTFVAKGQVIRILSPRGTAVNDTLSKVR